MHSDDVKIALCEDCLATIFTKAINKIEKSQKNDRSE